MPSDRRFLFLEGCRYADANGRHDGRDGAFIEWRTLVGGPADGVLVVTLSNGLFSVTVCPTRGMGVLEASADNLRVGWNSPVVGPVHPALVNQSARNGLGWLDGFSELLCRCGLSHNGPPGVDDGARSPIESQLTLHGPIANIPAHTVEIGFDEPSGDVWIRGLCREATLFGPQLELDSLLSVVREERSFRITDTVTNRGATPTDLQLLYHINVGPPFLEAGACFQTAYQEMSPRDARSADGVDTLTEYLGPTSGYAEQVYFFDTLADADSMATALLSNRSGNLGFSVRFNRSELPCLSQWKCTQPEADGYVTGIEPGTNFPNAKGFERQQGRVISLPAGASRHLSLEVGVHTSSSEVTAVLDEIADTQGAVTPTVHRRPTPPFAQTS